MGEIELINATVLRFAFSKHREIVIKFYGCVVVVTTKYTRNFARARTYMRISMQKHGLYLAGFQRSCYICTYVNILSLTETSMTRYIQSSTNLETIFDIFHTYI